MMLGPRCTIYFYLEDETIHVDETPQPNSGIPQGVFLKRHRVPKQQGEDSYYGLADLSVGVDVTFYGRTFHITRYAFYVMLVTN